MAQPFWRAHYYDIEYDPEDQNKEVTIVQHLQIHALHIQGNHVTGAGINKTHGNFTIEGITTDNKISFTLSYSNKILHFKGERNGNIIDGQWHNENYGGSFKFTYIVPKQGWNGSFNQNNVDSQMYFNHFVVQTVPNGKVNGDGQDEYGPFTLNGYFDYQTNVVHFLKVYENGNEWRYWGELKDNKIVGWWGYEQTQPQGTFEIYHLQV